MLEQPPGPWWDFALVGLGAGVLSGIVFVPACWLREALAVFIVVAAIRMLLMPARQGPAPRHLDGPRSPAAVHQRGEPE